MSFRFAEKLVLGNFIILAILWITRNPQFVPGWGSLFPKGYISLDYYLQRNPWKLSIEKHAPYYKLGCIQVVRKDKQLLPTFD